jgi:amino acid adenylation domain-containing protein/non-ribosomal peptide synthase protein (TIGR01720 family)
MKNTDYYNISYNSINKSFEEQVLRYSDNVALVYDNHYVTYDLLNRKANQLGSYLRVKYDIQPDDLIGICMDRSEFMLISIIGIMKSSAAYVPIDAQYPEDRISYILSDISTKVLITTKSNAQKLKVLLDSSSKKSQGYGIDLLVIDDLLFSKEFISIPNKNLNIEVYPSNLACVIYTSGTTGQPKGALISHKSIVHKLDYLINTHKLDSSYNILAKIPYTFDPSIRELLLSLFLGARLFILSDQEYKDVNLILQQSVKYQINLIIFVPSHLVEFINSLEDCTRHEIGQLKLRILYSCGEILQTKIVNRIHNILPSVIIKNQYGPTEACLFTYEYSIEANQKLQQVSIGQAVKGTVAYILDNNLNLVSQGKIGELYIGGIGLSRGYLNRTDLTAEKFIANPFRSQKEYKEGIHSRIYKTGDLVRLLPSGNLEYIGRSDFQVKIRGFRIELGEIENAIMSYPGIEQAVVIAQETPGNEYVVGYYVARARINEENILAHLYAKLPDYMVPQGLLYLKKLPLTHNGKVDRKSLPTYECSIICKDYVAPRDELELKIAQFWGELLNFNASQISINSNFFRLGGNSILAIRLISKINKLLGVKTNITSIFKHSTLSALCQNLRSESPENSKFIIQKSKLEKENQLLSYAQERLWFLEKYESGSKAYNIPIILEVNSEEYDNNSLIIESVKRSLLSIVKRHEVLSSLIRESEAGIGYQAVDKTIDLFVIQEKILYSKQNLQTSLIKDVNHIYDFSTEYPIKVTIYKLYNEDGSREQCYLSILIHHIAFDGWSYDLFLKELSAYFDYHIKNLTGDLNAKEPFQPLEVQYKDFAIWQREYLKTELMNKQLDYWKKKLDCFETLSLIPDIPRPKIISYEGDEINFEIDKEISNCLRDLSKNLEVSLYSLLLAAYYLFLRAYTNQNDLVIGTPLANRHYPGVENLIGFFVNSLPIRIQINSHEPIDEYIKRVYNEVVEVNLNQDIPFERIVSELNVEKDPSRNPIFQVFFGVENFGRINDKFNSSKSIFSKNNNIIQYSPAKFDIYTLIDDSYEELQCKFNYSTSLYHAKTIEGFIDTYLYILNQFAKYQSDYELSNNAFNIFYVKDVKYTSEHMILNQVHREQINSTKDKTIISLFENQVNKIPDNIALVYEYNHITYKTLNKLANKLANYLQDKYKVIPDDLIGICMDRSEFMLISIIGIMKSSAAYVPIDPSYPDERIAYILSDIKTKVVIINKDNQGKLRKIIHSIQTLNNQVVIDLLVIDNAELWQEIANNSSENLLLKLHPQNLAYAMYTSGTTGKPKGVLIEHAGIVNRIEWMNNRYSLNYYDKVLQKTTYVFDVSVWELIWALLYGAQVVLAKHNGQYDAEYISDVIDRQLITIVHFVPSSIITLLHSTKAKYTRLKQIFCSGEALLLKHVNYLLLKYPDSKISNLYGPTEASIDVYYYDISSTKLCIGMPISNTIGYVLNEDLNLTPTHGIGELYVGGIGLARGYLNRPDLTAEKFIANPLRNDDEYKQGINARLYKTGDIVRALPCGNLEYIGRSDFQVKIRGLRIELSEIENVLLSYHGIEQCIVAVKTRAHNIKNKINQEPYLVVYYISNQKLNKEKILSYLRSQLPEYMVPTAIVRLKQLPLTNSGKVDRKALPNPSIRSKAYVAPRNNIEEDITKIWVNILGLSNSKVGIEDDFFRLGGDSIISIQIVSRMRRELGIKINVKDIFVHKTIKNLYNSLLSKECATLDQQVPIKSKQRILDNREIPLLPVQKWFFANSFRYPNYWNQAFIIKTPELDIERLKKSIERLINYHDIFKLRYTKKSDDNLGKQKIYNQFYDATSQMPGMKILDVSKLKKASRDKELQRILSKWQSNFNLEKGPLHCIGYLHGYEDRTARIFFAMHHLIVDAISWRILLEDLHTIYDGKQLGLKGTDYSQWVEVVENYGKKHKQEILYWNNVLSDYDTKKTIDNLIRANHHAKNISNILKSQIEFEISIEQTDRLLRETHRAYNTHINDVLLTAFAYALKEFTHKPVNHIVLEGHGREDIEEGIDITRTVGWFTNMYPIRLEVKSNIRESLKSIKTMLRQVPNKGIGYGSLFQYIPEKLPKIIFNYLGQFNSSNSINTKLWNICDEKSGISKQLTNKDSNVIKINGLIINNKLKFNVSSCLYIHLVPQLIKLFQKHLLNIIDHCVSRQFTEYSINDFNDFEQYVQFNEHIEGDHNKLFFMPPAFGGAESYFNNIVPRMRHKNLILFNNYFLYLKEKFNGKYLDQISYSDLASEYINIIKFLQPKGPYQLVGWSFGGVLAFEIARQLVIRGEKVSKLVLIDAFFNRQKASIRVTDPTKVVKNNINYKYLPKLNNEMSNFDIILFKAQGKINGQYKDDNEKINITHLKYTMDVDREIINYYAQKTQSNHLDDILKSKKFRLIKMDANHISWINKENEIAKICKVL